MSILLCAILELMESENTAAEKPQSLKQSFWELLRFAAIALVIVVPIRVFIIEPFVVSGSSMFPTFKDGDYLIVDKISYELGDPKRDDVIIFRYPNDTTKYFIKRVIGLPNETVNIAGSTVTITTQEGGAHSFTLDEPYVKNTSDKGAHFELKTDEYFVMGDNRSASSDSRYWGAVPRKLMIGRALVRLLPATKIGILPGRYEQANK
jgi:signal peptidase I